MTIKTIILIYCFSALSLSLTSQTLPTSNKSVFFTQKKQFQEGFLITEISFPKTTGDQNFRFHQLSYSSRRFWEELRIEGIFEATSHGSFFLKANKCSLYASPEGIRRWYPIRSFDCDHIRMEANWEGSRLTILKDPRDEFLEFQEIKIQNDGEIIGVVVRVTPDGYFGFSSNLRYVVRNAKASFPSVGSRNTIESPILDGNDSLVFIKKQESVINVGDTFRVQRKKTSESFLQF